MIPVHVSSLIIGTTNYNRIVRVKLIINGFWFLDEALLVEDEAKNIFPVFINIPKSIHPGKYYATFRPESFQEGARLEIRNPYISCTEDEQLFLIVKDWSTQLSFIESSTSLESTEWNQEAEAQLRRSYFKEATVSYYREIRSNKNGHLTAVLLSNLAACKFHCGEFHECILFSIASISLVNCRPKPYIIMARALNKLGRQTLIQWCLKKCEELRAPVSMIEELCKLMGPNTEKISEKDMVIMFKQIFLYSLPSYCRQQAVSTENLDSSQLKNEGNDLFFKGSYEEASYKYKCSLYQMRDAGIIPNGLLTCFFQTSNYEKLAAVSLTGILISPSDIQFYCNLAECLYQLNLIQAAVKFCYIAYKINPEFRHSKQLYLRLSNTLAASEKLHDSSVFDADDNLSEQMIRSESHFCSSHWMFELNEKICPTFSTECTTVDAGPSEAMDSGHKIKRWHERMAANDEWPFACNTTDAYQLLRKAYGYAISPGEKLKLLQNGIFSTTPFDLIHRTRSPKEDVLQWWCNAENGAISPRSRHPYSFYTHQSFRNSVPETITLGQGCTHVSIGFADLSELIMARFSEPGEMENATHWVGYEASPYAVAKALVVSKMMEMNQETDHIIQVWYSTTWNSETLDSFYQALNRVLQNDIGLSPEVKELLLHWSQYKVSIRTARIEWLKRQNGRSNEYIFNLRRALDLTSFSQYLVSGDVLQGEHGSIVMFALPSLRGRPKYNLASYEIFFHCLPIDVIFRRVDNSTSIISAAVTILKEKIDVAKKWISKGLVRVILKHQEVSLGGSKVINDIRSLSPSTMSWSNIVDYVPNKLFHRMARKCSAMSKTIHYVQSMNWGIEVKGAFMDDYSASQQLEVLEDAKSVISNWYRANGLHRFLHDPPISDHRNIGNHYLHCRFWTNWMECFFKSASLGDLKTQSDSVPLNRFDVFSSGLGVIRLAYSYDHAVNVCIN